MNFQQINPCKSLMKYGNIQSGLHFEGIYCRIFWMWSIWRNILYKAHDIWCDKNESSLNMKERIERSQG